MEKNLSENEIKWAYCKKIIDSMKQDGILTESQWYWMILTIRKMLNLKVV